LDQNPLVRHTLNLIDQIQHRECASFLTSRTLLAAVLNLLPIFSPLFSPLKRQIAHNTDLWRKTIFNLCPHQAIVGVTTFE